MRRAKRDAKRIKAKAMMDTSACGPFLGAPSDPFGVWRARTRL